MSIQIEVPRGFERLRRRCVDWTRRFAQHDDPLVEMSNWVALTIGTHLPLWPLYLWAAAGRQVFPSSLWTMAFTPLFLAVPPIARRNGRLGRISMLLAGNANTVFSMWVLGQQTGTDLMFAPCAGLAAMLFRWEERWLMVGFALLPLGIWYVLQYEPLVALHHYGPRAAYEILVLNAFSVVILFAVFGWLQAGIYRRLSSR